jgi:magnesium transporter
VFDDEIPVPATQLYFVKRELMDFRRAALPLVEPLQRILSGSVPGISRQFLPQFSDVLDHLRRVIDEVEALNELMSAALQANLTLIQVQQNSDMRRISAWVGIGAVPTMVAGIYGMNFEHMPELNWEYGYFIVLALLGLISGGLFLLFRKYRWL